MARMRLQQRRLQDVSDLHDEAGYVEYDCCGDNGSRAPFPAAT
jgi:hypothetical protein